MPILTITYGDLTLFSGETEALRWDDCPGQSITVTGQLAKAKAASGGGLSAIADMIAQASKAKTAEKRRALEQTDTATVPDIEEDHADD